MFPSASCVIADSHAGGAESAAGGESLKHRWDEALRAMETPARRSPQHGASAFGWVHHPPARPTGRLSDFGEDIFAGMLWRSPQGYNGEHEVGLAGAT